MVPISANDRLHSIMQHSHINLVVRDLLDGHDNDVSWMIHHPDERPLNVLAYLVARQTEVDPQERSSVLFQVKRRVLMYWEPSDYAISEELAPFISRYCRFAVLSKAPELQDIAWKAALKLSPSDPTGLTAEVLETLAIHPIRPIYASKVWKPMLQRDDMAATAFRQLLRYSNVDHSKAFHELCRSFLPTDDGVPRIPGPDLIWLLALADDAKLGEAIVRCLRKHPAIFSRFCKMVRQRETSPGAGTVAQLLHPDIV